MLRNLSNLRRQVSLYPEITTKLSRYKMTIGSCLNIYLRRVVFFGLKAKYFLKHLHEFSFFTRKSFLLKIIAGVTLIAVLAQEVNLYAYEAGLSQNLQSPANIRPDVISEKLSDLSPEDLQIPDELGTVKAAHFVEGSKTVFHIQDLHINEAAQIQVARLLDYLNRNLKTNQVFIEGAAGEIAHALISKHPDKKALKLVARALLRQGKITGPEYYALVRNSEIVLSGIESDAGYEKNRLAYLKAQKLGERVQKQMKYLRRIVESLGVMIFDSAISEWLLRVDQFRNEKISVAEFGDYLLAQLERLKIDVNPFPELKHLKALREEENKLGKIVSPVSLNSVKLFAEIEKAQKIIEAAILNEGEKKRSAEEAHDFKEFVRLNQIVAAVESLITFSLNHEMATSMRVRAGEFAPRKLLEDLMRLAARHSVTMHTDQMNISLLEGALSAFQEFYQAALSRDDELLLNTMRTFEKNKIQRAVLVAGGFHTPYIEARLKRLGVSFVTITPRLEGRIDFKGDERIYRQSMEFGTSEESPNESLKDSQFQLQIPSRLPRVSDLENLNLGMSVSQAIRNNPRLEAGLEMILMTAVTSLRLRGKNPLQSVARFASSFPTSWKVFSRVYLKLYQPGVLQRQYKSGSGELVVPFEPELGFGLDARWNEGLGFAFNSLQSKSRGKSVTRFCFDLRMCSADAACTFFIRKRCCVRWYIRRFKFPTTIPYSSINF